MTDFNTRVWEAFWTDGNNKDGIERVVAVVFEEAARIAKEASEDAPNGNDNGATRDGWEMACKEVAKRLSQQVPKHVFVTPEDRGENCAVCGGNWRDAGKHLTAAEVSLA